MVHTMVSVESVKSTQNSTNKKQKGRVMEQIDYTKVTANEVLINCMECKGDGTLTVVVLVNESGEAVAYQKHGCYVCERD